MLCCLIPYKRLVVNPGRAPNGSVHGITHSDAAPRRFDSRNACTKELTFRDEGDLGTREKVSDVAGDKKRTSGRHGFFGTAPEDFTTVGQMLSEMRPTFVGHLGVQCQLSIRYHAIWNCWCLFEIWEYLGYK